MKIALAQLNYITGDFEGNTAKIIDSIGRAKYNGADIVVFSELSVTGHFPYGLLEKEEFIKKAQESISKIASGCRGIASVVGAPLFNENGLFNSACFLADGRIQSVHEKIRPDISGIFNENSYFKPGEKIKVIEHKGERIAITVGTDLPDDYQENVSLAINISASLFAYNDENSVRKHVKKLSGKTGSPVVYVNQAGANAGLIYGGGSLYSDNKGMVIKELKFFEEDFLIVDTDNPGAIELQPEADNIVRIHDALVLGIRDYFKKSGFKKAILGLSGGLDSAVATALAVRALGEENVRVLMLPSKYSSEHSLKDALKLAENLKIRYDILNIQNAVDEFEKELAPLFKGMPFGVAEENIQARARGIYLMAVSNKFGCILLNATNKSELAVGYGTLYGDMNGGLALLGDVYKTDVYKLAELINRDSEVIPLNIIVKPPSAELRPDQKDTDSLPEYEILDPILKYLIDDNLSSAEISSKGFDPEIVRKTEMMVNSSAYKRFQAPPVLRVSTSAFGLDLKMPLLAKY